MIFLKGKEKFRHDIISQRTSKDTIEFIFFWSPSAGHAAYS